MFLTLLSTCLLLLMAPFAMGSGNWSDYMNNHLDVDNSAVKACWLHQGTLEYVDLQYPEKGSICTYSTNVWTHDNNQALEYCESRHPYPIASAEKSGAKTKCAFRISLECEPDWYQANGKCYKPIPASVDWKTAKTTCSSQKPASLNPRIAEYYSDSLSLDFSHLFISEVWVSVPSLQDYFVNFGDMNRADEDSEAALFVLDGAYKYDIKPGTIILAEPSEKYDILCEYTPPMTLAEMYRLAEKYNEIYPFHVSGKQVVFASSSYMTVTHDGNSYKTDSIKDTCSKISKILQVSSFPYSSQKNEFVNLEKSTLANHRFHLTSASKNDQCRRLDFMDDGKPSYVDDNVPGNEKGYCDAHGISLSKKGRFPTMAAMRAPTLCSLQKRNYGYTCPSGWIPFVRAGGKTFCHYVDVEKKYTVHSAKQFCIDQGAALSGYESLEELKTVHRSITKGYFELLMGGRTPCKVDCQTGWRASWDQGVSRNNEFLNNHEHSNWWVDESDSDYISMWRDELHSHHADYCGKTWSWLWGLICGKYATAIETTATTGRLG